MKITKWVVALFLIVLLATGIGVYTVFAADSEGIDISNGRTRVNGEQNEDLFLSNGMVEIEEDVFGDVYATGGTIRITGDISENLIVAGGQVFITGKIGGDLTVMGGQVEISGEVDGDILAFAGTVRVTGDVGDDCRIFGGNVEIDSAINDKLMIRGSQIDVSEETSAVEKDVVIVESNKEDSSSATKPSVMGMILNWILGAVISILAWITVGMVVMALAPVKSQEYMQAGDSLKEALISFGVGLLFLPAVSFLVALLMISQVGWPLAVLILSATVLFAVIGWLFPVTGIMFRLQKKGRKNYYLALILGVAIAVVLGRIPWGVGLVFKVVMVTWGIGTVTVAKYKVLSKSIK
jgi:hypothetical protein